jgi:predicted hydrocarbon binding protein
VSSSTIQAPIRIDPAHGILRDAQGTRVAVLPGDLLLALHLSLFDRFADSSQDILYRAGYEQGLQDMVRLSAMLREEYGGESFDFWQMDAKFILETWWQPLAKAGWGACRFDLTALARGTAFVELNDSPIAAALGHTEFPICHFLAGLMAGTFSFFERAERHATEIECRAAGGKQCHFVISAGGTIDLAEGWRQQGVPATEIVKRLL